MENNNLIPFSKELWETGEYEAVNKREKNIKIYEIDGNGFVFGKLNDNACDWMPDGKVFYGREYHDTLMLRKKRKKVWRPLFETDYKYVSKEECEEYCSNSPEGFIKAIEVEI